MGMAVVAGAAAVGPIGTSVTADPPPQAARTMTRVTAARMPATTFTAFGGFPSVLRKPRSQLDHIAQDASSSSRVEGGRTQLDRFGEALR